MPETLDRPRQQQLPARQNGAGTLKVNMKAPVQSAGTLKKFLEDEVQKQKIADVLPKHMTPERILRVTLVAINRTPKLLTCSLESVFECILQAASLGLDPGGALGSSYLIPFNGVCKLIPGYRGLLDLARRSGEIDSITADVVYKHDKFTFRKGSEPVLLHEPDIFAEQKDEDIIGAYVVAHLKDGGKHIEFMNRQQIEKARSFSQTGKRSDSPWANHYPEMCRKTVVRRASKYLPISSEKFAAAIDLDNDSDGQLLAPQGPNAAERLNAKVTGRPLSAGQTLVDDDDKPLASSDEDPGDEPTPEQEAQAELRFHDFARPGADSEPADVPDKAEEHVDLPQQAQAQQTAAPAMTENDKWWASVREMGEGIPENNLVNGVAHWRKAKNVMPFKEHLAKQKDQKELFEAIQKREGSYFSVGQ